MRTRKRRLHIYRFDHSSIVRYKKKNQKCHAYPKNVSSPIKNYINSNASVYYKDGSLNDY